MKKTRLAYVLAITTLMATPAFAASMTMLQFGSFETREEAEKRLGDINSKYGAKLANLPTSIREIKLPPDNLTVYRTQAGPVESRPVAQGICTQLASAGEECYIVQTAMVAEVKPATSTTPLLMDNSPAIAAIAPTAPVPSFLPNKLAAAETAAQAEDAANLTSKLSTLQEVPARDATSRAMLSNINSPSLAPAPAAMAPLPTTIDDVPASSPELSNALDKAVTDQGPTVANINKVAASEGAARKPVQRSFWSRVNPFSDDDMAPAPKPGEAAAPAAIAAPVESVVSAPAIIPAPLPQVEAAQPQLSTPPASVFVAPMAPAMVEPLPATNNAISQPQQMRLPPPPAPLPAQGSRQMPQASLTTIPKPEPIAIGNINPPATNNTTASNGVVSVEEAKRVPVTQFTTPTTVAAPVVIQQAPRLQPPVSLVPSSTNGQKTQWAQIGPFLDSNDALAFWANYRQNHPDFPVVRVRVTTPYQQYAKGSSQSWLRIGPVLRPAFVNSLCTSLPANSTLRCGHVTDLGVASAPNAASGLLPSSRYKR